jgi:hypothetical protein
MTGEELQEWLNTHGQQVVVDGDVGFNTRAAIIAAFTNVCAEAITEEQIAKLAWRLGCSVKQMKAVAKVESGGAGFDRAGRPKILFERHKFYQLTAGRHPLSSFNHPTGGGYNEDSWDKLTRAAGKDAEAAFAAASWGKFQVLGLHWKALGYPSALEMAYSTVTGEAAHYEMLARYIEHFDMKKAIAGLSTDPQDNELFARLYNGPQFKKFRYAEKLAEAMK